MARLVAAIDIGGEDCKGVKSGTPRQRGRARDCELTAPERRHGYLVAAAGALIDFITGAKLQILAQADSDFAQPSSVAGHGNSRCREAGIDLDESALDIAGRDRFC